MSNRAKNVLNYFILIIVVVFVVAIVLTDEASDSATSYYEEQANCIAEYDYAHPETPMMDNLVVSLQLCQP